MGSLTSGGLGFGSLIPVLQRPSQSLNPPSSLHKETGDGASGGSSEQGLPKSADSTSGKAKWGFGMPSLGLGDAMGNMGGMFGIGGSPKSGQQGDDKPKSDAEPIEEGQDSKNSSLETADTSSTPEGGDEESTALPSDTGMDEQSAVSEALGSAVTASSLHSLQSVVEQTPVDPMDLKDATQREDEIGAGWENRKVHIDEGEGVVVRQLAYIIVSSPNHTGSLALTISAIVSSSSYCTQRM